MTHSAKIFFWRGLGLGLAALAGFAGPAKADVRPGEVVIVGDTIPAPLSSSQPSPARGRAIVLDRANGNCLICHQVPEPAEAFQGDLGPDLKGVGSRLSAAQIRLRLVDQSRLNAATLMPPFYRIEGLVRVAKRFTGAPVLKADEIEDVIAYLGSLKE